MAILATLFGSCFQKFVILSMPHKFVLMLCVLSLSQELILNTLSELFHVMIDFLVIP